MQALPPSPGRADAERCCQQYLGGEINTATLKQLIGELRTEAKEGLKRSRESAGLQAEDDAELAAAAVLTPALAANSNNPTPTLPATLEDAASHSRLSGAEAEAEAGAAGAAAAAEAAVVVYTNYSEVKRHLLAPEKGEHPERPARVEFCKAAISEAAVTTKDVTPRGAEVEAAVKQLYDFSIASRCAALEQDKVSNVVETREAIVAAVSLVFEAVDDARDGSRAFASAGRPATTLVLDLRVRSARTASVSSITLRSASPEPCRPTSGRQSSTLTCTLATARSSLSRI